MLYVCLPEGILGDLFLVGGSEHVFIVHICVSYDFNSQRCFPKCGSDDFGKKQINTDCHTFSKGLKP